MAVHATFRTVPAPKTPSSFPCHTHTHTCTYTHTHTHTHSHTHHMQSNYAARLSCVFFRVTFFFTPSQPVQIYQPKSFFFRTGQGKKWQFNCTGNTNRTCKLVTAGQTGQQKKWQFNSITVQVTLIVAMQQPLCLAWDTMDSGGVHHFKSKMHS